MRSVVVTRFEQSLQINEAGALEVRLSLGRIARNTYVDVIYCYRPSSVVCQSVCLSVTLVSPAKTAEPTEMPFGLLARMSPRNHLLDGVRL